MCDFFILQEGNPCCGCFWFRFFFFRKTFRCPSVVAPVVMETNHYRLIFQSYGQLKQTKCSDVFYWFIFLQIDLVKPVDSPSFLLSSLSGYKQRGIVFFLLPFTLLHIIFTAIFMFIIHRYVFTHEYLISVLTQKINFQ